MSLSEFLQSFDAAADATEAVLDFTLASADERLPELAEAIEYCAIPRRFDAQILGVLRNRPEDHGRNEELLDGVLAHSFVRERESGGYVYHDSVRERLLARWQRPERRERLEAAVARLVEHHENMQKRASRAEEDAARVHRMIRRGSSARYLQLTAALEQRLIAPLLEAVDVLALLSPNAIVEFLEYHLLGFDDRRRYTAATLLLRAGRAHIAELPEDPDVAGALDRLACWEGRLLLRMNRAAAAERVLAPLAAAEQPDPRLRLHAMGELGQAQRNQWHLREALRTFEQEVELSASSADPEWLTYSHLRLGDTQLLLDQPRRAREAYTEAVATARQLPGSGTHVEALAAIAAANLQLGERADARMYAIEALDVARTSVRNQRAPYAWLCALLAELFADESPELLDTVSAEAKALASGFGGDEEIALRRVERLELLRDSGQLQRASARVATIEHQLGLRADKAESSPLSEDLRCHALIAIARLDDRQARTEDAMKRLGTCERLARTSDLPQFVAEARQRRGRLLAANERWTEAEQEFAAAEEGWLGIGHDASAALAQAERGFAARAQGRQDEAERLIEDAAERLEQASPDIRMRFLAAWRDHEAALGRHSSAEKLATEAAELCERRGSLRDVARARARLALLAGARGSWSDAADHAEFAGRAWAQLAAHNVYRRTSVRQDADARNGEGVRCLLADDPAALTAAIEQFEGAIATVSEPWYRLNLSYALAATGDWGSAISALEQAVDESTPLQQPALFQRLAQHHLSRGWSLYGVSHYEEAAQAFADSVARLDRPEQSEARRDCMLALGDSLREKGATTEAAAAYRDADAAGHPYGGLRLAEVLIGMERRDEARELLRRSLGSTNGAVVRYAVAELLDLDEDHGDQTRDDLVQTVVARGGPAAALELGDLLDWRGHPDAAIEAYRLVQPTYPEAALRLARHFRRSGDMHAAVAHYAEAVDADDPAIAGTAAVELGDLHRSERDPAAAIDAYRRAVELTGFPGAAPAALALGELLLDEGDLRGAEAALRPAIASDDADAVVWAELRLGEVFERTGRHDLAHDAFRRVLGSHDPDAGAEAALQLLTSTGDGVTGEVTSEVIAAVLRAGARVAVRVGEALTQRGMHVTAEELLQRASELPDDLWWPDAALLLGDVLSAHGDAATAGAAYERAARSNDEQVAPEAALRLIDRQPEAADHVLDAVVADGGWKAHRLAALLAERGDHELAKSTLERAATQPSPTAAEALILLGDIHADGGDLGAAGDAYERARTMGDFWVADRASERLEKFDGASSPTDLPS